MPGTCLAPERAPSSAASRIRTAPRSSAALGVVRAELLAEAFADLADRAPGSQGLPHRHEQVFVAPRHPPHLLERGRGGRPVTFCPHARRPLQLPPLRLRVDPLELDRLRLRLDEPVHADDYPPARLDLRVVPVRRLLDLALHEPLLDRLDGAPQLVHPLDQLPRLLLELPRERLDEVRAADRAGGVRAARLGREDLLRPQRD